MSDWNAELYLKFKKQRTQPAIDLAKSISDKTPKTVADIGCGPGNSTSVLVKTFKNSKVIGLDSSPDMIKNAKEKHPETEFRLCDARELTENYDVIFSNACLQWIPDHSTLLPYLMSKLNDGGTLAVQIPMNTKEPLFQIIDQVAKSGKYDFSNVIFETNETMEPQEYYDILNECASDFRIWETVYYHNMPDCEAMLDWVKGTRLRPYLDALNEDRQAEFLDEILREAQNTYKKTASGEVILKFRRFFFVAEK